MTPTTVNDRLVANRRRRCRHREASRETMTRTSRWSRRHIRRLERAPNAGFAPSMVKLSHRGPSRLRIPVYVKVNPLLPRPRPASRRTCACRSMKSNRVTRVAAGSSGQRIRTIVGGAA